jgi:putative transposase
VGEEDYLLGCYRYIELNPKRAGMVTHPSDYPWSSYRCNARGEANRLISPHPLYRALGQEEGECRRAYRGLFRRHLAPGLVDEIRRATNGGFVLGSERFQSHIAAMVGRRTWRGAPGRPRREAQDAAQKELGF